MSTDIASLRIKVDTKEAKTATNDLNKLSQSSGKAQSSAQGLNSSFLSMRGTLAALGVGLTVGQLLHIADSYTKITAQLKLATKNQLEFNEAYKNVQRIASGSQSSIEETSVLYSRLSTSLQSMNASQKQVSDITEAVALGLKISGASSAEASASMLQLSQAFGAGALAGDEFRSINESAPRIMQALAESIGVSRGELKQMAADGKLTSDIIGNALLKNVEKFRTEAEKTKNISGGIQGVSNEFTLMVGEIDKATGASTLLAQALAAIAQGIKDLRTGQGGWLEETIKALPTLGLIYRAGDLLKPDERLPQNESSGMIKKGGSGNGLLKIDPNQAFKAKVADFLKGNPLNDEVTKKAELELVNKAERLGEITHDVANRYRKKLNDELKKFNKDTSDRLQELGKAYAELFTDTSQLSEGEKTHIQLLQEKLDALSTLDVASRNYVQTIIDTSKAVEMATNHQEAFDIGLENEAELFNANADAAEAYSQSLSDAYTKTFTDLTNESEDLRVSLIRNDKERVKAQAELENKRREDAIYSMNLEESARDDLLQREKENAKLRIEVANSTKDGFADLERAIDGFAKNSATAMADFIFGTKGSFSDMVNSMLKDIARLALQKSIFDPIAEGISGSISSSGGVGSWFKSMMPSFANGSDYIPHDMVANIHQGERILTRDENKNYAQGGGNVSVNVTVNSDGSSNVQSDASFGKQLGNAIKSVVQAELLKQKRQGGLLSA